MVTPNIFAVHFSHNNSNNNNLLTGNWRGDLCQKLLQKRLMSTTAGYRLKADEP